MGITLGPERLGHPLQPRPRRQRARCATSPPATSAATDGRHPDRRRRQGPAAARSPDGQGRLEFHAGVSYRNMPGLSRRSDRAVRERDEDAAAARHPRQADRRPPAEGPGQRPAARADGAQPADPARIIRSTRRAAGRQAAGDADLALGPGPGAAAAAVRARSTASAGRSSAASIWCAASACCSAGRASTCPARPAISTPTTPPRAGRRRGAEGARPGLRPRRGAGRGVARGQGRREGQGAGADRPAHRRPAAGGAAAATATGASWSRRTIARRCGRGPMPTARCRSPSRAPASRRRARLPMMSRRRPGASWPSRRDTS